MSTPHTSPSSIWLLAALCLGACTAELGAKGEDGADGPGAGSGGDGDGDGAAGPSPTDGDGTGALGAEGRLIAGRSLRRLSIREIEATLDTLFPELAATRARFPKESFDVFDNDEGQNDAGLSFLENAALVMFSTATEAQANPTVWSRMRLCAAGEAADVCVGSFYDKWAPLLLRRPGVDTERIQFVALAAADLGTEDDVLAVALESLLRHPEFLYRVELGDGAGAVRPLTHSELLGRLSFLLWGEGPDEALVVASAGIDLANGPARNALAVQMLTDARARRQLVEYHAQWLGFATLDRSGIGEDMWQESRALIERVSFEEATAYTELLLSNETFASPDLAAHYGLPAPAAPGWIPVTGTPRAGILGQGSFLSSFANIADTSPVKRGKHVQNRLLCRTVEIPKNLVINADAKPAEAECRVDFMRENHAVGSCAGCHETLDGIGFGLDTFDRFGVEREAELGKPQCTLPTTGTIDGVPFEGPRGLGERLVEHEEFAPCFATQLVRFYAGKDIRKEEQATNFSEALLTQYEANGGTFQALLLALVTSEEFAFVAPQ